MSTIRIAQIACLNGIQVSEYILKRLLYAEIFSVNPSYYRSVDFPSNSIGLIDVPITALYLMSPEVTPQGAT
jgi:hypothetical protein